MIPGGLHRSKSVHAEIGVYRETPSTRDRPSCNPGPRQSTRCEAAFRGKPRTARLCRLRARDDAKRCDICTALLCPTREWILPRFLTCRVAPGRVIGDSNR